MTSDVIKFPVSESVEAYKALKSYSLSAIEKKHNAKRTSVPISEAFILFDEIVEKFGPLFADIEDGCVERAKVMTDFFYDKGINCKKAWIYGGTTENPISGYVENRGFNWRHHVATALPIERSGIDVIFDPSMFDAPVFFGEWKSAIDPYNNFHSVVIDNNSRKDPESGKEIALIPCTHNTKEKGDIIELYNHASERKSEVLTSSLGLAFNSANKSPEKMLARKMACRAG